MKPMSSSKKQQPGSSPRGEAAKQAREERSAKALRDNLRRRKMQERGRQDDGQDEGGKGNADKAENSPDS